MNENFLEKEGDFQSIHEKLQTEFHKLKRRTVSNKVISLNKSLNPDRADLAQSYTVQEQDKALQLIEKNRLDQLKQALERLESGTYGKCIDCGKAIALERLLVLPTAEFCIHCQEKHERS